MIYSTVIIMIQLNIAGTPKFEVAQIILQGTVKEGARQGRQKTRWEDNIREWTDLEFVKSQRVVENRETWRKLVVKLSVVPC